MQLKCSTYSKLFKLKHSIMVCVVLYEVSNEKIHNLHTLVINNFVPFLNGSNCGYSGISLVKRAFNSSKESAPSLFVSASWKCSVILSSKCFCVSVRQSPTANMYCVSKSLITQFLLGYVIIRYAFHTKKFISNKGFVVLLFWNRLRQFRSERCWSYSCCPYCHP